MSTGQELFFGCQEALLDLRKDESFDHLILLPPRGCLGTVSQGQLWDWKPFAPGSLSGVEVPA